jgi:hypothetical protein
MTVGELRKALDRLLPDVKLTASLSCDRDGYVVDVWVDHPEANASLFQLEIDDIEE